ncbi:MAG: nuclear transport factor 2 family protein [Magnetovibrio sp.]|nr:nuclear transport factor 2 family protein [Magnetovibrio sp.]
MSTMDFLGTYAEGWTNGDGETILSATSDAFVFDDPNAGPVSKADFPAYMAGLRDAVAEIRGGDGDGPFMELSEVVTNEDGGVLTAWCWWEVPGTDIKGSGLIKVAEDGVVSERITYYAKLPG